MGMMWLRLWKDWRGEGCADFFGIERHRGKYAVVDQVLNLLPKRQGLGVEEKAKKKKAGKIVEVDNVEFGIEEIYSVPSVGYVIGGVLKSGIISPIQDYAFSSSSSPIPYRPDQLIETEDSHLPSSTLSALTAVASSPFTLTPFNANAAPSAVSFRVKPAPLPLPSQRL
ncbi:hypothetical protein BC829DRAFT_295509 [Chytridium lagenaria]|nr:hypothetical protein BC829DRAFT_295509 [Chytridium lagenaria]